MPGGRLNMGCCANRGARDNESTAQIEMTFAGHHRRGVERHRADDHPRVGRVMFERNPSHEQPQCTSARTRRRVGGGVLTSSTANINAIDRGVLATNFWRRDTAAIITSRTRSVPRRREIPNRNRRRSPERTAELGLVPDGDLAADARPSRPRSLVAAACMRFRRSCPRRESAQIQRTAPLRVYSVPGLAARARETARNSGGGCRIRKARIGAARSVHTSRRLSARRAERRRATRRARVVEIHSPGHSRIHVRAARHELLHELQAAHGPGTLRRRIVVAHAGLADVRDRVENGIPRQIGVRVGPCVQQYRRQFVMRVRDSDKERRGAARRQASTVSPPSTVDRYRLVHVPRVSAYPTTSSLLRAQQGTGEAGRQRVRTQRRLDQSATKGADLPRGPHRASPRASRVHAAHEQQAFRPRRPVARHLTVSRRGMGRSIAPASEHSTVLSVSFVHSRRAGCAEGAPPPLRRPHSSGEIEIVW